MPYVDNQGVRIHYHLEGEGPPLVVLHGLTGDLKAWYDTKTAYIPELRKRNQLILLDARGHGASDKPHDPKSYDTSSFASDVTAVLDELNIDKTGFFGHSMGGWIGWCVANHAPDRIDYLIIGGQHPYEKERSRWDDFISLFRRGMDAWIAELSAQDGAAWTAEMEASERQNDLDDLLAVSIAMRDSPGMGDMLPNLTVPCLLYSGDEDAYRLGIKRAVENISDVTYFSIPGDHGAALFRDDLVLPHITTFLEKVNP